MREVVSLVFRIRDAKLTIAKDEGGKVDFFLGKIRGEMRSVGIRLIYTEGPTSRQPKAGEGPTWPNAHGRWPREAAHSRRNSAQPKLKKNPVPRQRFK